MTPARTRPEVFTDPTRYEVSCLPIGHEARREFTLTVEWRSPDRWAVCDRMYRCVSKSGSWSWERQPSSRTDHWIAIHRFPLDVALALAQKHAPKMRLMRLTVQDVLDGKFRP